MKLSKYLCAVTLIVSVAGCNSSTKASAPAPSSAGGSSAGSPTTSSGSPTTAPGSPTNSALPIGGPVKRVAELGYAGGFAVGDKLKAPSVVVYSDGSVVFSADKRLTLTPGALAVLISALQPDLQGQPGTVQQPKSGHANPDAATTGLGVLQADGKYQMAYALGLTTGTESKYSAPLADAFDKLDQLTTDATTPYTATRVRYALQCPQAGTDPVKPWPAGVPQAAAGQGPDCLELRVADGATAGAVRAGCTATGTVTPGPQPTVTLYSSDKGPRTCRWRYALPDETS